MTNDKNETPYYLATFLLIVLSFISPILFFSGSIDSFAPSKVPYVDKIIYLGEFDNSYYDSVPFFYIFGAMLSLLSNLPFEELIFLPIQLVPFIATTFAIFRSASGSSFFAGLIVLLNSISDINGNKFFFWIHGLGSIEYFNIILLSIIVFNRKYSMGFRLLFIIYMISIVFLSYNQAFMSITFLSALMFSTILARINKTSKSVNFNKLILMTIVVQLGISKFIYKSALPQFQLPGGAEDAIDNFFSMIFGTKAAMAIPNDIIVIYPKSIGLLGGIKYFILLLIIVVAIYHIINSEKKDISLGNMEFIFLALLFSNLLYFVARLFIGQFSMSALFYPGLFGACLLKKFSFNDEKYRIYMLIIAMILISSLSLCIFVNNDIITKLDSHFDFVGNSADWYIAKTNESSSMGVSDILTTEVFNFHLIRSLLREGRDVDFRKIRYSRFDVIDVKKDIYPLLLDSSIPKNPENPPSLYIPFINTLPKPEVIRSPHSSSFKHRELYYVLNYKMNKLDLNGWVVIRPWSSYGKKMEYNSLLNKIYTTSDIRILLT